LCIPTGVALLPDAYQRLKAIEYYSDLGSGYQIAMKDLEIRGAGNLFGYEQSGQISNVGFELYNKILGQAVLEKRGEGSSEKREKVSVVYSGGAQIDKEYMPLVQDRLYFYQKISVATTVDTIGAVKSEIIDRFGPLREETRALFSIAKLQCALYSYPFSRCKIGRAEFSIELEAVPSGLRPQLFFEGLRKAFYSSPHSFKIVTGRSGVLVLSFKTPSLSDSLSFSKNFVELFSRVAGG
jgi:transcription-repair coupling factor (superfamily II helicase)